MTYDAGDLALSPGMAVAVGLGARKICQGIVLRVHDQTPGFRTRRVERILHEAPLLGGVHLKFWQWVASYYMCTVGEVMAAALPAALRPEGMSAEEFARDQYRAATVVTVELHPDIATHGQLDELLEKMSKKAPRQYAAMLSLCEGLEGALFGGRLPRARIAADSATLRKLEQKGLITILEEPAGESFCGELSPLPTLTGAQSVALDQIVQQAASRQAVLLHGASGSGKTEIFIRMAARELDAGRSVLYLLPEIPLSLQLIDRLGEVFGPQMVACHSRLTPRRRAEAFMALSREPGVPRLVVGTRGAVFLPVANLGLVVVDEEHDRSFKQDSPAPRFHARDCALVLAAMHGAGTVLGSATPSLESWQNAASGKYGLVTLSERYGQVDPPEITISDTLRAAKRGERTSHFNFQTIEGISRAIGDGGQAIVFQNRRGFSPWVECGACGWVAHCPDCNVTLTLHRAENRLRCHYCGYSTAPQRICPSCGNGEMIPKGYGTEKVEDELGKIFPDARIGRLDSDTASSTAAAGRIISRFAAGQTDILVGTQMVTKGFDFGGVRFVGVVNADNLLNYPDFRASEHAFQTLVQAAGRAGRRGQRGQVVIQSTQPSHPVLRQVAALDYGAMAAMQLAERHAFFYPPFCRLIAITLKHRDPALTESAANALAALLRPIFGRRVLGPEAPAVDRVQREHIRTLLLKVERERSFSEAKALLAGALDSLRSDREHKKVTVTVDVDPR